MERAPNSAAQPETDADARRAGVEAPSHQEPEPAAVPGAQAAPSARPDPVPLDPRRASAAEATEGMRRAYAHPLVQRAMQLTDAKVVGVERER